MESNYIRVIDPPSGWKYGFPKVLELKHNETIREFLMRNGYPQDELDFAMKHLRSWTQSKETK